MSRARVIGLHLDGWHDAAVRDWSADDDAPLADPAVVDGGLEGAVVLGVEHETWLGGPQAALAPHGRGGGWGAIGAAERRIRLVDELDGLVRGQALGRPQAYAAAVDALAHRATVAILAVPDRPEMDEAAQGHLLEAVKRSRRRHVLLWRSVALFLDAVKEGQIPDEFVGEQFRLLVHASDGFETQVLHLRADPDHPGHVAPEREGYGRVVLPELGLSGLRDRSVQVVLQANPSLAEGQVDPSRLPLALMCGRATAGETEVLRRQNGTWLEIRAPSISPDSVFGPIAEAGPSDSVATAGTFLATPLQGAFAEALTERLKVHWPDLTLLPWTGIARGALRAGRLIQQGLPHYFDRLQPIGLAVLRGEQPVFDDLIGERDTVAANREFVSPPYRLTWARGKTEIDFYVAKGAEVRHWMVRQEEAPQQDVDVELRVRQTPGQSWAKLSVTSTGWEPLARNPIFLDWAALTPLEMTPDEVLATIRTPPPPIPERIVEPPHLSFWTGDRRGNGLLDLLRRTGPGTLPDLQLLSTALKKSQRQQPTPGQTGHSVRPVGTDGSLPAGLAHAERERFHRVLNEVAETVATAQQRRPPLDNYPILCVTWTFTLCPDPAKEAILDALEAAARGERHALLNPPSAITVLTQGAGRVMTGAERLARLLRLLSERPANNDTINALATIMTRRREAPAALTADIVATLFEKLAAALLQQVRQRSFKTLFRNTLSALAGMFRWREIEPYALLAARDEVAARAKETLLTADAELHRLDGYLPQVARNRMKIVAILAFLDGGGDPNILRDLEDDDDADDSDG